MVDDPRRVCVECYGDLTLLTLHRRLTVGDEMEDMWIWVFCKVCLRCGWMTVDDFYTSAERHVRRGIGR